MNFSLFQVLATVFPLVNMRNTLPQVLFHPMPSQPFGIVGGKGQDAILIVKRHWFWILLQVNLFREYAPYCTVELI